MRPRSGDRNRAFELFWLGNTVSQFGDRISELALPLIAVVLLHTGAARTATLVAVIWLPNIISPVVGAWVDARKDKRRLLIAADLLRTAALLSLPVTYLLGHLTLWDLYLVGALTGIGQMAFDVSYPAFFITLVPRSYYVVANSKLSTSRSASFVLGPALGGLLIQAFTAPVAVLVDAITFLFSSVAIGRIKTTASEPPTDSAASLGRRLWAGLRFNIRHPIVHACLGCSTTMNFFMFVVQGLLILFASRVLGLSAGVIGVAMGIGAVGGLLGALVAKKLIDVIGLGRTMMLGALFYPTPILLLAIAHGPHVLTGGVLGATEWLSGMGVMLYDIANNSLKAAVIPQSMRSRSAGAYSAVNYGSRPLGALAGGWLGSAVGLRPTLIIAAVGGALGCLWLLASPIPRIATVPEPGDPVVTGASKPRPRRLLRFGLTRRARNVHGMDTPVHRLCDSYVDDYARLQPVVATAVGISDYDDRLPDLSPDGHAERAELIARTLRAVRELDPSDEGERDAKAVLTERLGIEREIYDMGLVDSSLNVQASPAKQVRQVFDLMATDSPEAWHTIAARMSQVPAALAGYRESLRHAAARNQVAPARQVRKVAEQCMTWAGLGYEPAFFESFAGSAADGAPRADLAAAAAAAGQAYAELATFLHEELLPRAPEKDAVGAEVYGLWLRMYVGARLDLMEAYEWAWAEFMRIETEMAEVAHRIKAGASVHETSDALDADPRYRIVGVTAFRDWAQELSDRALSGLRGVYFEIPDKIMRLDCRIAPSGSGSGAYYTGPSDDFTRAGAMWWTLPQDKSEFTTWREASIVYHEGVPGHHLQIATTTHESQRLNRYQRLLASVDAHCEGWARYGEGLMRELGYLSDDGNLMGMLNESLFRTARVIIDLGTHLELEIPAGTGFHEGERWTPELGLEFILNRTITEPALVRDGIDRSLGWPGHALSYKLGERLWLFARDDARARAGSSFDLKEFHMQALRMGPMGLDTLRERLAAATETDRNEV